MDSSTKPFQPDPTQSTPLYQQLYGYLRTAIVSGELKRGMTLPSTRALASRLNLSRNTVLNAYQQLLAEGYLESITGSGTYVARVLPDSLLSSADVEAQRPQTLPDPSPTGERQPLISAHAQLQRSIPLELTNPAEASGRVRHPFNPTLPALDAFPYALWSRLVVRQARRMPGSAFTYHGPHGYRPLCEAIAAYVTVSRQVRCTPEQVIIVPGSQGALDLAARVLVNSGDPVWIEDPGYEGARGALLGAGARVFPVPVDEEGLVVSAGIERAPHARLAYVTPSHQFPLGVTMSLGRRLALLDWARRADAYILEDDYDSEYRFSGRPLAALQGLDGAERVIYIGTFSKVLFPALRLGYLILPPELVEPFLSVRRFIDTHPPILEQAVLTEFLNEGHFVRHLRRMRTLYARRRLALLDAFRDLPVELQAPEAGIHCVGWLPDAVDLPALIRAADAQNLDLISIASFSMEPLNRQGLLLGYGGFSVEAIQAGARRLAAALRSM